ncbi:MAG TPA: SDR family oxidoreductase [Spirochaetia bacterium]|nr:SDR family oxidoreductase [Spirochaetia bacterium]
MDEILTDALGVLGRFDLSGRTALVIGGSKGLGQAMALALAGAGANVSVAARGEAAVLATVEMIRKIGRDSRPVVLDATNEEAVKEAARSLRDWNDGIDILVNSQGMAYLQDSTDFDMDSWKRVMATNLESVVLCCKYFGRGMIEKGHGKIINVSSVRAFQGRARDLAYAPSKGAINQLTRSLAIEWGSKGINVNGIAPVFTRTEINEKLLGDPKLVDWIVGRIPMGRLGMIADVMGPVVFLASHASDFVNGHILPVDGGWLSA